MPVTCPLSDTTQTDASTAAIAFAANADIFIEGAAFTGEAGQLRQSALPHGNTLLAGDTNGDKIADFAIHLRGAITFTDADFIL